MAFAINYAALSAEQMDEILMNIKEEKKRRVRDYANLPVAERLRRLAFAAAHINLRVVDLTAKVAAQTESLAAAEAAKQQLLIKEHTREDIQVADYDIETAQYYLNKTKDLLARSKETQRKFAEKHC
jgi:hypothetical protein